MADDADKKSDARFLRNPVHENVTRKVAALPTLVKKSERPDGQKALMVEEEPAVPASDLGDEFDDLFDDLFDD